MEQASTFGGWRSTPISITGLAPVRQLNHVTIDSGGVEADCVASQFMWFVPVIRGGASTLPIMHQWFRHLLGQVKLFSFHSS